MRMLTGIRSWWLMCRLAKEVKGALSGNTETREGQLRECHRENLYGPSFSIAAAMGDVQQYIAKKAI